MTPIQASTSLSCNLPKAQPCCSTNAVCGNGDSRACAAIDVWKWPTAAQIDVRSHVSNRGQSRNVADRTNRSFVTQSGPSALGVAKRWMEYGSCLALMLAARISYHFAVSSAMSFSKSQANPKVLCHPDQQAELSIWGGEARGDSLVEPVDNLLTSPLASS